MNVERATAEPWLLAKPTISHDIVLAGGIVKAGWKVLEVQTLDTGGLLGEFQAVKFGIFHSVSDSGAWSKFSAIQWLVYALDLIGNTSRILFAIDPWGYNFNVLG